MVYIVGWLTSFLLLRIIFGIRIYGRNNIPKKGAFIFASNHTSNLDPFILGTSFYRPLDYMAKEELFQGRFSGWLFRKWHAHPVKRGATDYRALKDAFRILGSGNPLLIFPEGTRSRDGKLQPAKPGIGFIAHKTGVPVVPAYIEGSFRAMPGWFDTMKWRSPIKVYIGEPVDIKRYFDEKNTRDIYQNISDDIMGRIIGLKDKYADKAC